MDDKSLRSAALRLAEGEGGDEKPKGAPDNKPTPDGDPDWQKVQTMFDTSLKSTFTDLRQAVKDEDSKLTVYHMERVLEAMVKMAKYMRMREVSMKLKETEKKLFE